MPHRFWKIHSKYCFRWVAHPFHFHIKQLWIVAIIIKNYAFEKKNILIVLTVSLKVGPKSYKGQVMSLYINVDLYNQGLHYRGVEHPTLISKLGNCYLSMLATISRLVNDNPWTNWNGQYSKYMAERVFYSFICKSWETEYITNILCFIALNLANRDTKPPTWIWTSTASSNSVFHTF